MNQRGSVFGAKRRDRDDPYDTPLRQKAVDRRYRRGSRFPIFILLLVYIHSNFHDTNQAEPVLIAGG